MAAAIPDLLAALRWDGKDVTFTPAVRSGETRALASGALSTLGRHCAVQCDGQFLPHLLSKQPHESLHFPPKTVPERINILEAAAFTSTAVTTSRIIVVDDLITSGLTLSYSAKAIKDQNPWVSVYGLALGKHEYLHNLGEDDQDHPNSHIPVVWDELWQRHDGNIS